MGRGTISRPPNGTSPLDFQEIGLGVEIGGKRPAVIPGVDVQYVDSFDTVQQHIPGVSGERAHDTWVEPGTENPGNPGIGEPLAERPLEIVRFWDLLPLGEKINPYRGIHVGSLGLQARLHHVDVDPWGSDVDHDVCAVLFNQIGDTSRHYERPLCE